MKYCSECGNVLEERKRDTEWYCVRCKAHTYANPIPTIDAILIDENGRILLGKRNRQPDKGKFNLPGGFVDPISSTPFAKPGLSGRSSKI